MRYRFPPRIFFPPRNLIPKDPTSEDMTVFIWGEYLCFVHRIIAFQHTDIARLPLHAYRHGRQPPFLSMHLREFELFRGQYCFESVEEFEHKFSWR